MHTESKRGTGRGGRGRGRGAGRGKRGKRIVSDDESTTPDSSKTTTTIADPEVVDPVIPLAATEPMETAPLEAIVSNEVENVQPTSRLFVKTKLFENSFSPFYLSFLSVDIEADISQLEAPTFTTITRGPPEPMLRLKWNHKVMLIGEKVLNPMIHSCDTCLLPILHYGRMVSGVD